MSPSDPNLWLFLNETLPAEEGPSLLGTFVADVQHPTNRYEPKHPIQPRQHPFLSTAELLKPCVEDRTIIAGTNSGRAFDTGLCSFISGNTSSSRSRQAELISTCITTHTLRSPDEVFRKIRNDAKNWQRVEELMQTGNTETLYLVAGYKIATDPIITLQTSKQRSHGGELTLPLIEAATCGLNLPAGIIVGDPRLAASFEKGSTASQSGLVKGERLFAIQYWTLVKRSYFRLPKSRRNDGVRAKAPRGKHLMFHGGNDSEEDDEDEDEYDDASDDEDHDEWSIIECSVDDID
ncbi:hypothetical protein S40288_10655 [Stachybotrys chartarum IBT 40288]|nr:hypothetical protein S40288_10655 [Stachybotrys chartarum IBT 40288]